MNEALEFFFLRLNHEKLIQEQKQMQIKRQGGGAIGTNLMSCTGDHNLASFKQTTQKMVEREMEKKPSPAVLCFLKKSKINIIH